MRQRTHVETRPGAVVHSDVADINGLSLRGEIFFVKFIHEASERVEALHMKVELEATKLLKRHVRCIERQTGTSVKKVVLDGGKKYLKGSDNLEQEETMIFTTATSTTQDNDHAKREDCTINNVIRTLLVHAGAPANLWDECLYTVCDGRSRFVRTDCKMTREELLTGVKPLLAHIGTSGYTFWARVADETGKALRAKERSGILLLFDKHRVMIAYDQSVQTTQHCLVREDQFQCISGRM